MKIFRTTGFLVLCLLTAFFLYACGGDGDSVPSGPPPPEVTTLAANPVTDTAATLNGTVNPNGQETESWFEWDTDPDLANFTATLHQSVGAGSTDVAVGTAISGLVAGETYYFRVAAQATAGGAEQKGTIQSFVTFNLEPTVATDNATNITTSGATVNGTVNPNGLPTNAWFEWGTDPDLATFDITTKQSIVAGTTPGQVSSPLTGLGFGTVYYFRVVASNSIGEKKGEIKNFATSDSPPTVTTKDASGIAPTGATLNGTVNPNGLDTDAWFEWGTDPTLSTFDNTDRVAIGNGTSSEDFSDDLVLNPDTVYYFRIVAENTAGKREGSIVSFDTIEPPPTADAGSDQNVFMGHAVTLDGSNSSTPVGDITSYLWEQESGTTVTLDNSVADNVTFTAPAVNTVGELLRFQLTVTDDRDLTATDNVDVTVRWGFFDDFSTAPVIDNTADPPPTKGAYYVWPEGGSTFTYLPGTENILVETGNDSLYFSKFFYFINDNGKSSNRGVFSIEWTPTGTPGAAAGIKIALGEGPTTYYQISTIDNTVTKAWGSSGIVETVPFTPSYSVGVPQTITITFTPNNTIFEGLSTDPVVLSVDNHMIAALFVGVTLERLDAYFDDFKLEALP